MKIRLSELRRLIREATAGTLGWPTKDITHVYGVPDRLADKNPTDLGDLKLPKGPNSRDDAEDRPLTDMEPANNKGKRSYGARRGVATSNKSNNNSGSST